jgi:DNA-binding GntR family transcriptional regulator
MPSAPADSVALVDEVVARLEHVIVTGELKPGEKLFEQALSARFGISRAPLREAIRTLEARRLVERRPFAGVRVVDLSVDEVEQLLVTREALEGMACRQAAENMTLGETRQLRASVEGLRARVRAEGVAAVLREDADNDFHLQIARGSRNLFLADIICRDLYPLLRVFRYRTTSTRAGDLAAVGREHSAIVNAIERRDTNEAERLMRSHIAAGRESLMRHLRETPSRATNTRRLRPDY